MMEHYVDLHMHTQASDGTWSPKELVQNIKRVGISTFAVTDHDEILNVEEVQKLSQIEGLTCIRGVELSASYQNREYHILTYDFDLDNEIMVRRVKKNHQVRLDYHRVVIETLKKAYKEVSTEEFSIYQYDLSRGGWPSLNYLLDKKVVYNMNDFFNLMKRYNLELIFDAPDEIIKDIRAAGATAILAHPPAYTQGDFMSLEQLENFISFGIQGLECYSPYYKDPSDSDYYVNFCRDRGLFISGGSDCHGLLLPNRKLRHPAIRKEQLNCPFLI